MKKSLIISSAVVIILVGGLAYIQYQSDTSSKPIESTKVARMGNSQVYPDSKFSYECPQGWQQGSNKNYNGLVNLSQCGQAYSGGPGGAFDDGVDVTFGFVPQSVADSYEWAGKRWSDTLIDEVKNETNAQPYSRNNFMGWVSMKSPTHTLSLIARYQVSGGYYEVSASAMGGTKTDQEFKRLVDGIISTFKVK